MPLCAVDLSQSYRSDPNKSGKSYISSSSFSPEFLPTLAALDLEEVDDRRNAPVDLNEVLRAVRRRIADFVEGKMKEDARRLKDIRRSRRWIERWGRGIKGFCWGGSER